MKKLTFSAFSYAIAAMVGGVFYREFTKLNGFTGKTTLRVLHTHLFLLGMFFLLLVLLLQKQFDLNSHKLYPKFFVFYNVGVVVTAIMLFIRGVLQVLGTALSPGINAAISGISGLGHLSTGIGIILFFCILRNRTASEK